MTSDLFELLERCADTIGMMAADLNLDNPPPILAEIDDFLTKEQKRLDTGKEKSPCCNAALIEYRSFNKKVCSCCSQEYDWHLKPGQQPLIKATR